MRDEVTEDERLATGIAQDVVLDEASTEHEGLELQCGVEDPEQAENDLERPLRADGEREAAGRVLVVILVRARVAVHALLYATGAPQDGSVRADRGSAGPQASLTAATSFCRVSLASPKSMVVLGS